MGMRQILATRILLKCGGEILLLRRPFNEKDIGGLWCVPGGKVEPGEPVLRATIRELFEETGIRAAQKSVKLVSVKENIWRAKQIVNLIFSLTIARKPAKIRLTEHSEWRWFPENRLPKDLVPSLGGIIRKASRGDDFMGFA
jgi:8-oxo-dGTP diphosphatase